MELETVSLAGMKNHLKIIIKEKMHLKEMILYLQYQVLEEKMQILENMKCFMGKLKTWKKPENMWHHFLMLIQTEFISLDTEYRWNKGIAFERIFKRFSSSFFNGCFARFLLGDRKNNNDRTEDIG